MFNKFRSFTASHPLITAFVAIAVATCVVVWGCLLFLDVWTHHGDDAVVPEIKDMPYSEAVRVLEENNLNIEISDSIYDKTLPGGTVVESWPKGGSTVKRGRSVYVTVTAFSPKHVTLSMPVTGVSVRQAVSYLSALGITGIRFVNVPSQYPDLVESAHAQGRPIGVGSVIPVDATVVLEVGVAMPETESENEDSLDMSAEETVEEELGSMSVYTDI
ncbi:MAG: PASTA domain-containing protein [Odoribacter sp.]|nr:PASTA domain-containing protein [Odoribacter sp.]